MDQDTFKLDKRKSPIIRPKPRPDSMLQAEPAPDVEFDNRDDLIQKLPRPKPRPVMIGSNPKTGATRGIDPALNYSPEDLKRLLMQSAMERLQTEGEAGDHDRMYKVVHVKKGMMDIKAKTSYEAAKKFAQEKGLKSTAGVDVHLYPLEEAIPKSTMYGLVIDGEYVAKGSKADMRKLQKEKGGTVYNAPGKKVGDKEGVVKEGVKRNILYREIGKRLAKGHTIDKIKKHYKDIDDKYPGHIEKIVQALKDRNEIPEDATANLDKNFFRNIASMDEPHEEINRLLTADGPEGDVIRREYEITAGENGLHPDDDFEEILDMMVHDFEDMTFENMDFYKNMNKALQQRQKDKNFKSNMPVAPPRKKNDHNWRLRTINPAIMPGMPGFGDDSQKDKRPITTNLFNDTKVREGKNKMGPQEIMPGDRVEHEGDMYEVVEVDGFILTVDNLQTGNRTQLTMDDVTRLSGMDAMTDQDKQDAEAMFKRLKKVGSGSLKHVATEGYYTMPDIDRERYTEMPGLEGPFQTRSGKPIYYDPKEGSYYDRDTDMYLTYSEFKALDDPKPETGRMKEAEFTIAPLPSTKRVSLTPRQNFSSNYSARYQSLYPNVKKEGHSPHKKGTKKYKAHMAAMHANSVDLNKMRDALKLDESADANTVVAEYTRATLDLSYKTWKQVDEQIAFIRSFVKEDIDVSAVATMLRKMHERENLDHKMLVKENIDKLRQIVKDKSAMPIKFTDGSMKVDMTTASIFLQIFDKVKAETQAKIVDKIQTKAGFLSVLDLMYKKIG